MTVRLHGRSDIDLDAFERVTRRGEGICLDENAESRMSRARESFLALLDSDPDIVVYGVTSGYGQNAYQRFTLEERRAHARKPSIAPMTSFGRPLPGRVVRGIVLARLANFVEGHAAVTPELGRAVAAMLDSGKLPVVPMDGTGCAGEIQPLSHLFAPLASGFPLAEKEALALINGSPTAAALVADAVLGARHRQTLLEGVFALSIEALQAPLEAYDSALTVLWNDPDEAAALRSLAGWLESAPGGRRPYQAPVSWRILPRVLGQARRALRQAEEVAEASLGAVTDNPIYLPPDDGHPLGRVISNGGYHNARAYPALDALTAVYADLALLADRHVTKLLDGKTSLLPHQLQVGEAYLGTLGFAAAGWAEQARQAARTTLLPGSEGGGFGQNDVAVPVMHAWRRHREAATALESAVATLAVVCSQAFRANGHGPAPALDELLAEIRAEVPPVIDPQPLGPAVERLAERWHGETAPEAGTV
ncbi:aromatic amino acid lyase [Ferruginivarius sediminum]|uniref:Histidine ammonia-lyase n=1 Tax=Ferruginivarius sediminum TaxID=2661937 RepID=A0A369TGW0_9PROT|nr:aromatic amino acid lyase [Ferruginivarius sediminum]RDD63854.1 histidine ammonia-lyase [Ferruginivarius sediminum]